MADDLNFFNAELLKNFQVKVGLLGPDESEAEVKEIRFFHRVIT